MKLSRDAEVSTLRHMGWQMRTQELDTVHPLRRVSERHQMGCALFKRWAAFQLAVTAGNKLISRHVFNHIQRYRKMMCIVPRSADAVETCCDLNIRAKSYRNVLISNA